MGTDQLRKRSIWQNISGSKASKAEYDFYNVFYLGFKGTNFKIRPKPKEFKKIYVDFPLPKNVITEIYNPEEKITTHGISPDYAIDHIESGKKLYIEVKRQDGWVEGKSRSAGRGNAHERSNKYFSPGLLKILRKESRINKDHLPFWTVFIGDITRDPCRVREITCWFDKHENHFYFWRNTKDPISLINHFDEHLKPLLL